MHSSSLSVIDFIKHDFILSILNTLLESFTISLILKDFLTNLISNLPKAMKVLKLTKYLSRIYLRAKIVVLKASKILQNFNKALNIYLNKQLT